MRFWPSDSFEIETTMTPEEIVDSLKCGVEPKKLFRFSSAHTVFQGDLMRDGFKISRIIHYRNSFLPIVHGTFRPGHSGSIVSIKMRLHRFVAAFMCFWFGGVVVGMLAVIFGLSSGKTQVSLMLLIPFGMLAFGWALVSGGFWFEAKKQKLLLIEMFKKRSSSEQDGAANGSQPIRSEKNRTSSAAGSHR
jgi:hypothetical protein